MAFVKVTGYLEVDESDLDSGPHGPLTEEAFERLQGFTGQAPGTNVLEDLTVEADDR